MSNEDLFYFFIKKISTDNKNANYPTCIYELLYFSHLRRLNIKRWQ